MTGSNDKDTLDTFFRDAFEQLPESPSASGWDAPSTDMWSRIQSDLQTAPTPPAARFSRLWYVGVAAVVTLVALFFFFQIGEKATQTVEESPQSITVPIQPEAPASDVATLEAPAKKESAPAAERKEQPEQKAAPKPVATPKKVNVKTAHQPSVPAEYSEPQVVEDTPKPEPAATTSETPAEAPNTLKKKELEALKAQEEVEIKDEPRAFPNNLERIKAEAAKQENAAKTEVDSLKNLPKNEGDNF